MLCLRKNEQDAVLTGALQGAAGIGRILMKDADKKGQGHGEDNKDSKVPPEAS